MSNADEINSFVRSFVLWNCLAIIAAYILVICISAVYGYDEEMNAYQSMQDQLTDSRALFLDKADPIQTVAASLVDSEPGLQVFRAFDGTPYVFVDGKARPLSGSGADEDLVSSFTELYAAGTGEEDVYIFLTIVQPYGLEFYTGYSAENGFSGILYEFTLGVYGDYTVIELTENWQLFYEELST